MSFINTINYYSLYSLFKGKSDLSMPFFRPYQLCLSEHNHNPLPKNHLYRTLHASVRRLYRSQPDSDAYHSASVFLKPESILLPPCRRQHKNHIFQVRMKNKIIRFPKPLILNLYFFPPLPLPIPYTAHRKNEHHRSQLRKSPFLCLKFHPSKPHRNRSHS